MPADAQQRPSPESRNDVREVEPGPATRPRDDVEPGPAQARAAADAKSESATLAQVVGAVFWSFFGVRKGALMRRDAVTIKPLHVILVGVFAAVAFVVSLLMIVRFIIRMAG